MRRLEEDYSTSKESSQVRRRTSRMQKKAIPLHHHPFPPILINPAQNIRLPTCGATSIGRLRISDARSTRSNLPTWKLKNLRSSSRNSCWSSEALLVMPHKLCYMRPPTRFAVSRSHWFNLVQNKLRGIGSPQVSLAFGWPDLSGFPSIKTPTMVTERRHEVSRGKFREEGLLICTCCFLGY